MGSDTVPGKKDRAVEEQGRRESKSATKRDTDRETERKTDKGLCEISGRLAWAFFASQSITRGELRVFSCKPRFPPWSCIMPHLWAPRCDQEAEGLLQPLGSPPRARG